YSVSSRTISGRKHFRDLIFVPELDTVKPLYNSHPPFRGTLAVLKRFDVTEYVLKYRIRNWSTEYVLEYRKRTGVQNMH
ncbi:hypothetical protein AVEN_128595-1, partial [Araneus ventricosus]